MVNILVPAVEPQTFNKNMLGYLLCKDKHITQHALEKTPLLLVGQQLQQQLQQLVDLSEICGTARVANISFNYSCGTAHV